MKNHETKRIRRCKATKYKKPVVDEVGVQGVDLLLVLERRQAIMAALAEHGSARVADLAEQFEVTDETIRRDLDHLEEEGKLRRTHGGAIAVTGREQETPYWFREVSQEKEKAVIVHNALNHVSEGDRIILDASTTAWHMAKRLRDMDLTVVTNSIRVCIALSEHRKVSVLSIGGQLSKRSLSYVGSHAAQNLRNYHVDKVFLSCAGVELEHGISDLSDEQAGIRRTMLEQADHRFLLADHSKFGVKALSVIGGLNLFDEIITDGRTPSDTLAQFRRAGVKVTVADSQLGANVST